MNKEQRELLLSYVLNEARPKTIEILNTLESDKFLEILHEGSFYFDKIIREGNANNLASLITGYLFGMALTITVLDKNKFPVLLEAYTKAKEKKEKVENVLPFPKGGKNGEH